jgi:Icc-related predicted phosphoesterase
MVRLRRRRKSGDDTTLFFATDLHGSEVCFRKFIAAASFYGAQVLILGGDLTGKFVVPIVSRGDGTFLAEWFGQETLLQERDVARFAADCANQGMYAQVMTSEEYRGYEADSDAAHELFLTLMCERLEHWMTWACQKLEGSDVRVVTAPGNDDPFVIDEVIRDRGGDRILLCEGEIFEVAPGHEMLSTGWSNETPWRTHRETSEDELAERIAKMAERLEHPRAAIFNIHVPPYDSGLDTAPQLDEHLRPITSMGAPVTAPAGSRAVREAIERYQPLASLHGHIHESGGVVRIGRTVAINAGSEYAEGVLRGALLTIGDRGLTRYQQTAG